VLYFGDTSRILIVPEPRPRITFTVERTDRILADEITRQTDLTFEDAQELVRRGAVWLNRYRALDPDMTVPDDSSVVIHFPPRGSYDEIIITLDDILWEDDVLLALNKRPGWHANYTPWDMRGTIPYALEEFVRRRGQHQLDRDTSGVLLVSKDPAINPAMQKLFLNHRIDKRYLAITHGIVQEDAFEIKTGHGRGRNGLFRVYPLEEVGTELPFGAKRVRHMETRFEVLARGVGATLVRAMPITGRTHQIRLHLAHVGHPIIGDLRYGGTAGHAGCIVSHHLLHAARIELVHPHTRAPLVLSAPLPTTWLELLKRLGFESVPAIQQHLP
jgi:23S rRNA pseudouridine1911/1915/1917 synthase